MVIFHMSSISVARCRRGLRDAGPAGRGHCDRRLGAGPDGPRKAHGTQTARPPDLQGHVARDGRDARLDFEAFRRRNQAKQDINPTFWDVFWWIFVDFRGRSSRSGHFLASRTSFQPCHAGLWGLARSARLECDFKVHVVDFSEAGSTYTG